MGKVNRKQSGEIMIFVIFGLFFLLALDIILMALTVQSISGINKKLNDGLVKYGHLHNELDLRVNNFEKKSSDALTKNVLSTIKDITENAEGMFVIRKVEDGDYYTRIDPNQMYRRR